LSAGANLLSSAQDKGDALSRTLFLAFGAAAYLILLKRYALPPEA